VVRVGNVEFAGNVPGRGTVQRVLLEGSVLGRCLLVDSGYCEGIEVMKVQMRCNYGPLGRGEVYTSEADGPDWYQINGLFVYWSFVDALENLEPTRAYLPVTREEEHENYAQYINREMPPVACW